MLKEQPGFSHYPPLSSITLLIRKGKLIWLLHLDAFESICPAEPHPFSKLLIPFRVTKGNTGQMDTLKQKNTLLLLTNLNKPWSHATSLFHKHKSDWQITKKPRIEWTLLHPHCLIISPPLSPSTSHLSAFLSQCVLRNENDHGGDKPHGCLGNVIRVSAVTARVLMWWEWGNTYLAYECKALSGRSCRRRWLLVSKQPRRCTINNFGRFMLAECYKNIILTTLIIFIFDQIHTTKTESQSFFYI